MRMVTWNVRRSPRVRSDFAKWLTSDRTQARRTRPNWISGPARNPDRHSRSRCQRGTTPRAWVEKHLFASPKVAASPRSPGEHDPRVATVFPKYQHRSSGRIGVVQGAVDRTCAIGQLWAPSAGPPSESGPRALACRRVHRPAIEIASCHTSLANSVSNSSRCRPSGVVGGW